MTLVISCVIFAALLPILVKTPLSIFQNKQAGGYDNHNPRIQQQSLTGIGHRALAAHQNAFEAFPPFAAGVILALWANAPIGQIQMLCVVFIIARIAHPIFYLADIDKLRSLSWVVGLACSIWLMCLAF